MFWQSSEDDDLSDLHGSLRNTLQRINLTRVEEPVKNNNSDTMLAPGILTSYCNSWIFNTSTVSFLRISPGVRFQNLFQLTRLQRPKSKSKVARGEEKHSKSLLGALSAGKCGSPGKATSLSFCCLDVLFILLTFCAGYQEDGYQITLCENSTLTVEACLEEHFGRQLLNPILFCDSWISPGGNVYNRPEECLKV